MALPIFFQTADEVVDNNTNENLPIVKLSSAKKSAFGGTAIQSYVLPENAGGTVVPSGNVGANSSKIYSTKNDIQPKMALLYNAHGNLVTPNFGEAIDSSTTPFNFAGIALTQSALIDDNWFQKISQDGGFVPPPRDSFNLVYIKETKKIFLFGGQNNGAKLNDNWEWDGKNWQQRTITSPTARIDYAIANGDLAPGPVNKTILFGGFSTDFQNDTWWYSNTAWVQQTPVTSPTARIGHAMVYDSKRQVMVMFGGYRNVLGYNNQTWEYDGVDWVQKFPATSPAARNGHGMAFDSFRNKVVLFGGRQNTTYYGDTWEYDGTNWTQVFLPGTLPSPRQVMRLTYNSSKKAVVMFGGADAENNDLSETWEYDGSTWEQVNIFGPSPRNSFGFAYSAATDKTVLFGGNNALLIGALGETWELGTPQRPVLLQTTGDGYVYYDASPGRPTPVIGDFLGPSSVSGTVTPLYDGYSPVFGIATEGPVIDPDNAPNPLELTLNGSTVGVVKMRIRPFYGFIPPLSPSITNFSPSAGIVGEVITLNGSVFVGTTQVTINDTPSANAIFNVISNNQITFTVPAGAQKGTVTVFNAQGNSTSSGSFTTLPSITSVIAPVHSVGAAVTINGYTFTYATSVKFNGVSSPFVIVNDSQLTTTIPVGGTTGNITVTITYPPTDTHIATYSGFDVVPPPTIDVAGVAPLSGAIGSYVSLTGTGLAVGGTALDGYGVVEFVRTIPTPQTLPATRTVFNDTTISVIVPNPGVPQPASNYNVRITTNGGVATSSQQYAIVPVPKFLDSPGPTFLSQDNDSDASAGTMVRILGDYGFTGVSQVTFSGFLSPSVSFINDGYITAIVPSVTNLSTNLNGSITGVATLITVNSTLGFPDTGVLFIELEQIAYVSKTSTTFTVQTVPSTGRGFNGTSATPHTTGVLITAYSDVVGPISVKSTGGIKSTADTPVTAPINFTILQQPSITSFSPAAGKTGDLVTIHGSNFLSITSVKFPGNISAAFSIINSATINATVPSGVSLTPNKIIISNSAFTVDSGTNFFTFYPAPSITSRSPTDGGYGTDVTISGTNILNNGTPATPPTVTFGGLAATVTSFTPGIVHAIVPNPAGNGIVLTTDGGSSSIAFTVIPPPVIYSFYTGEYDPHSARLNYGGDTVVITGNNFRVGFTTVYVIQPPTYNYATPPISVSPTQITFNSNYTNMGPLGEGSCYIRVDVAHAGGTYSTSVYGLYLFYAIG